MAQPHEPAPAPADGMCQESTGFLFSHACDRFAAHACIRCGKWVCNEHNHEGLEGAICTTCAKREPPPPPTDDPQSQSQTPGAVPQGNPPPGTARSGYYRDDPYFYGSYWYPGYGYHSHSYYNRSSRSRDSSDVSNSGASNSGHDPYDFTEGDAESLRQEGDDAFETDLGES